MFLAAIVAAFWTLRNEEIERATDAVRRDTEAAQQQIRSRLSEDQDLMIRLTQRHRDARRRYRRLLHPDRQPSRRRARS